MYGGPNRAQIGVYAKRSTHFYNMSIHPSLFFRTRTQWSRNKFFDNDLKAFHLSPQPLCLSKINK